MAAWINRSNGIAGRNGTYVHTINFTTDGDAPFTPTDGNLLVLAIGGPVVNALAAPWITQLDPTNTTQLTVATCDVKSISSVTIQHPTGGTVNQAIPWSVYEFPAGSRYLSGAALANTPVTDPQPSLTGLPGTSVTVMYA